MTRAAPPTDQVDDQGAGSGMSDEYRRGYRDGMLKVAAGLRNDAPAYQRFSFSTAELLKSLADEIEEQARAAPEEPS